MAKIARKRTLKEQALCFLLLFICTGCSGTWVWQEDYPKHKTMYFKCPRWNYNEAYDELHHIYATRQHEPIKINESTTSTNRTDKQTLDNRR